MTLKERTALVTGGGRGIGRAVAEGLAAAGAGVVVNYLADEASARRTVAAIRGSGGRAWALQADVADPAQVEALFARAGERLGGGLDILVNNAGGPGARRPIAEMSLEEWRRCLAVNLDGVFLCTRAAMPLLPDGRGRIVNVTSISARSGGGPGGGHYAAAKGGVSNFTRACAKELAPRGITVNGVAPGVIDTDLHRATPREELASVTSQVPLGRAGTAAEVAASVVFLCGDEARYITGEILEVNGGLRMD